MKQGKNPTREQKKLIERAGLDPANWLVAKDTPEAMTIRHRYAEAIRVIRKASTDE